MIRRLWPIGVDERPRNRASLAKADTAGFREWLRNSVLSWTEAADDGERVSAFAPLVLSPTEPARQFSAWAAGLPIDVRARVRVALSEVIECWDPGMEPRATILLVRFAAYVGCRRAAACIMGLFAKPVGGTELERRDLAEAAADFGRQHATPQEARALAYRLREIGLDVPTAAVVLLSHAAKVYGADIVDDFACLAPDVVENDPDADPRVVMALRRFAANSLVDILGVQHAYVLALKAQARRAPELRAALCQHRLQLMTQTGQNVILRDRLTNKNTRVDVSGARPGIINQPPAMALLDQMARRYDLDERLRRGRR